jgi:hypothetical protein
MIPCRRPEENIMRPMELNDMVEWWDGAGVVLISFVVRGDDFDDSGDDLANRFPDFAGSNLGYSKLYMRRYSYVSNLARSRFYMRKKIGMIILNTFSYFVLNPLLFCDREISREISFRQQSNALRDPRG